MKKYAPIGKGEVAKKKKKISKEVKKTRLNTR